MRIAGFYWVRMGDNWQVARWSSEFELWTLTGIESSFDDGDFDIIHKQIIDRPITEPFSSEECEEDEIEPCPTCGEVDGMKNPCCAGYDPLHFSNCGYG